MTERLSDEEIANFLEALKGYPEATAWDFGAFGYEFLDALTELQQRRAEDPRPDQIGDT